MNLGLQLVPERIPALDEERKNNPHASQETHTPQVRHHIRRPPNIQRIICNPTHQIRATQRIQRLIRQLRDIPHNDRGSKEPEVLKPVLLRALSADNLGLGRFVDALVALGVARVGARVLVVELAERGCVEVRCDGEDPGGGDGVEGLLVLLVPGALGLDGRAWSIRSFAGRRGYWRPW